MPLQASQMYMKNKKRQMLNKTEAIHRGYKLVP